MSNIRLIGLPAASRNIVRARRFCRSLLDHTGREAGRGNVVAVAVLVGLYLAGGRVPTLWPLPRSLSWRECGRLFVLMAGIRLLNWYMNRRRIAADDARTLRAARRYLALSGELFGILGEPEPQWTQRIRAVMTRPLPDGSTLLEPSGAAHT